jgi:hypothetical protein
MDLVSQIEDEMSPGNILKRQLVRDAGLFHEQAAQDAVYSIRPRAEYLAAGNPDAAVNTANILMAKKEHLFEMEPKAFGHVQADMQHWEGDSATKFIKYLSTVDTDYRIAYDALNDLGTLYSMYGSLVTSCHNDLIAILQNGLLAFQNVDQQWIPVVLDTAAAVLAPLTAGDSLTLITLSGIVASASLVETFQMSSSSDLATAQSILNALDSLKSNTNAHIQQLNDTLVELQGKIGSATADVQNNIPQFAQPGQPFAPGALQPDSQPPNLKPVSTSPLIPGLAPGTISHLLNV